MVSPNRTLQQPHIYIHALAHLLLSIADRLLYYSATLKNSSKSAIAC
jgi:hypothetical protein